MQKVVLVIFRKLKSSVSCFDFLFKWKVIIFKLLIHLFWIVYEFIIISLFPELLLETLIYTLYGWRNLWIREVDKRFTFEILEDCWGKVGVENRSVVLIFYWLKKWYQIRAKGVSGIISLWIVILKAFKFFWSRKG